MKPVLFQLGPFPVSSFGVFLLLAFLAGIIVMRVRTARLGWDAGQVLDLCLYAIIGGVVGARVAYILINLKDFVAQPFRMVMVWTDAGLVFYGALAGGQIVVWLYARSRRWGLGQVADAGAPGVFLGYAISMIGTLLYGLNYGRPTTLPWGVPLFGDSRHPTQLYLMVASLLIFAILLQVDRRGRGIPSGGLFLLGLFLYAIARTGIEVFMDSPRVLGPLTLAQGASIIVAVLSVVMWLALGRRGHTVPLGTAREGATPGMAPRTSGPQPGAGDPRG